jgi:hypothetical protein
MAESKTKPTSLSVAAFIDALTDRTRRAEAKTLVKLMRSAAGDKPKMWGKSIISFGSYHYTYDSGREGDMPLICFSRACGCNCSVQHDRARGLSSAARKARQAHHRQGLSLHKEAR